MDRVSSNSSSTANMSYDPNACELSPPKQGGPQASRAHEDAAHEGEVCAATGLKGPLTAAQRYAATLAETNPPTLDSAPGEASALLSKAASEPTSEAEQAALSSMLDEARDAALDTVRSFLSNLKLEAGHKLETSLDLPNGCEVHFSVEGSLEKNAEGQPVLVSKVSGSIEGGLGAVSAELEFSYSCSSDGDETISFEACVFGGVDQDAANLVELEAKAGVCATYSDSASQTADLAFELVAKTGAKMNLDWFGVNWAPQTEARYPLTHEAAPDVIR